MQLDMLRALDAIVENGSISLAAQALHKTQPAISMALKKLEQEIGFEIFDRQGYRLSLTEQGKIYYQKSRAILEQVEQLNNLGKSFNRGEEHKVTIAVEGVIDQIQLWQRINTIQQQYKNTELHFMGVHLLHGLQHLTDKDADMAVTPWLPTFASEGNFTSKQVGQFSFTLCGHKSLFEPFGVTSAEQINEHILKQLPQVTPTNIKLNLNDTELLKPIGSSLVKLDDMYGFLAALKAKLGWGPLPLSEWTDDMENDFYRFSISNDFSSFQGEIRVVRLKSKILGPVAQAIWDRL